MGSSRVVAHFARVPTRGRISTSDLRSIGREKAIERSWHKIERIVIGSRVEPNRACRTSPTKWEASGTTDQPTWRQSASSLFCHSIASAARKVPIQLRIPFSSVLVLRGAPDETLRIPRRIFSIEILWTNYLYRVVREMAPHGWRTDVPPDEMIPLLDESIDPNTILRRDLKDIRDASEILWINCLYGIVYEMAPHRWRNKEFLMNLDSRFTFATSIQRKF